MFIHRSLTVAVKIIFSVMFLSSTLVFADDNNTDATDSKLVSNVVAEQSTDEVTANMIKVYQIGKQFGFPETLQAIMLQESGGVSGLIGNRYAKQSNRSYGLMQLQLDAVRSILERYPEVMEKYFPNRDVDSLKNKELIHLIMKNNEANILIAAYLFSLYAQLADKSWEYVVAAYNVGIGGVKRLRHIYKYKYVVDVKAKLKNIVIPFNQQNQLLTADF